MPPDRPAAVPPSVLAALGLLSVGCDGYHGCLVLADLGMTDVPCLDVCTTDTGVATTAETSGGHTGLAHTGDTGDAAARRAPASVLDRVEAALPPDVARRLRGAR